MRNIISSIGIGTAAADSIGYRAPARYRSNPIPVVIEKKQVAQLWQRDHASSIDDFKGGSI